MLFYHNSSVASALIELFPKIGLEKSKFRFRCMFRSLVLSFASFLLLLVWFLLLLFLIFNFSSVA